MQQEMVRRKQQKFGSTDVVQTQFQRELDRAKIAQLTAEQPPKIKTNGGLFSYQGLFQPNLLSNEAKQQIDNNFGDNEILQNYSFKDESHFQEREDNPELSLPQSMNNYSLNRLPQLNDQLIHDVVDREDPIFGYLNAPHNYFEGLNNDVEKD